MTGCDVADLLDKHNQVHSLRALSSEGVFFWRVECICPLQRS